MYSYKEMRFYVAFIIFKNKALALFIYVFLHCILHCIYEIGFIVNL